MSTSGAYDTRMSAYEIIAAAGRRGLVLREGQTPDLMTFETGRGLLTRLLKNWTLNGPGLWRDEEQTVTLVAGRATYALKDRPMQVRNVRLVQSGIERRPLARWGRDDYDVLPMKTQGGAPTSYVVNRLFDRTELILWPVPNAGTYQLKVGTERVIEDVTGADEDIDAPQEWFDAVIDALGVAMGEEEPVPSAALNPLRTAAAAKYELVQGHDRSGPVMFEMDFGS